MLLELILLSKWFFRNFTNTLESPRRSNLLIGECMEETRFSSIIASIIEDVFNVANDHIYEAVSKVVWNQVNVIPPEFEGIKNLILQQLRSEGALEPIDWEDIVGP